MYFIRNMIIIKVFLSYFSIFNSLYLYFSFSVQWLMALKTRRLSSPTTRHFLITQILWTLLLVLPLMPTSQTITWPHLLIRYFTPNLFYLFHHRLLYYGLSTIGLITMDTSLLWTKHYRPNHNEHFFTRD